VPNPNPLDDFEIVERYDDHEEELPKLDQDAAFNDLRQLESMGFENREKNITLLAKYKGDLLRCVEELLEEVEESRKN